MKSLTISARRGPSSATGQSLVRHASDLSRAGGGGGLGDQEEMRDFANTMEKVTEAIANIYVKRTGQSVERIQELMSDETWMTAPEAQALDFADEVTEPAKMAAHACLDRFTKVPAALVAMNPAARSTPKPGDPSPAPADPAATEAIVARAAKDSSKNLR